ncbi:hypothetical protein [Shewanella sp. SR43-8]|uniref:hypothetical protein n=1 Tax=Shewanella sp. SR43-8 TaxID=2760938 RepID=UPI001603B2D8|nr:hypothetical protein [Shewanella sp. SR43-8]MBB1322122.1 hypothetical protein [Shewanella sp. SR43-8]
MAPTSRNSINTPLNNLAVLPKQNSPFTADWLGGFNSLLTNGLDSYMKYEQIQTMKDYTGQGQRELNTTTETVNPNNSITTANAAQTLAEKAAMGLKIGTGTLFGAVALIAILFWLSRK